MARSGADARHLVGGDAHTNSGAADENAAVHLMLTNGAGDTKREIGVIDAFARLRPDVQDLVAEVLEKADDSPFDFVAAMVAADCDFHCICLSSPSGLVGSTREGATSSSNG